MQHTRGRTARRIGMAAGCLAALAIATGGSAQAGNLEPAGINLGGTSFFDGFGGTSPGLSYLGYYQYSHLDRIVDNNGNSVGVIPAPRIDVLTVVNQLAYTTGETFFGGQAHLGFTGLLPLLHFNTSVGPGSVIPLSSQDGFGDLTLGADLQFNPVIESGRPVFSQRVELDLIAPIGRYSTSINVNPGAHFWSLSPYWAGTWLPTPKTEVSLRLNYLYNFSNSDTGIPGVSSDRAGQAAWANFAMSYAVTPTLNVGINGYYFRQLTADTYTAANPTLAALMNGDTGKAQFLAIGPGLYWKAGPTNIWSVNLYRQTDVRNHTGGDVLNVHWLHPF